MSRITLTATDGMILTNGKTYGRVIFLGTGDSPDNWQRITEAQAQRMMEEREEAYEADLY